MILLSLHIGCEDRVFYQMIERGVEMVVLWQVF
jgi:hypothetical protein